MGPTYVPYKTHRGLTWACWLGTDGSKMNNLTAATAVGRDVSKSLRISSQASIFTAEVVALDLSPDIIRHSKCKKIVIFSDSLSSLLAINNRHLETCYVQKFITDYSQLSEIFFVLL